jgi:hypothetical protein
VNMGYPPPAPAWRLPLEHRRWIAMRPSTLNRIDNPVPARPCDRVKFGSSSRGRAPRWTESSRDQSDFETMQRCS